MTKNHDKKRKIPKRTNEPISIFFAADDSYLPYLEVAIASLSAHANDTSIYNIYVLSTQFSEDSLSSVRKIVKPNITISVCNLGEKISEMIPSLKLRMRDYYSESIYYRMFIPGIFGNLHRAVYLDSDIVLLDDVAKLYHSVLGDNLIGAVSDESVTANPIFCDYVEGYVGVEHAKDYFNSGVLVMDLDNLRKAKTEETFMRLLEKHNFPTVAPDQDYLNYLCRGRVCYLPGEWNKHALISSDVKEESLHLVHYNMFNKPWHYRDVPYEKYFWQYAKLTDSYNILKGQLDSYSARDMENDIAAGKNLLAMATKILSEETPIFKLCAEDAN